MRRILIIIFVLAIIVSASYYFWPTQTEPIVQTTIQPTTIPTAIPTPTTPTSDITVTITSVPQGAEISVADLVIGSEHRSVGLMHPVDEGVAGAAEDRAVIGRSVRVEHAVTELVVDAVHRPAIVVEAFGDFLPGKQFGKSLFVHGSSPSIVRPVRPCSNAAQ